MHELDFIDRRLPGCKSTALIGVLSIILAGCQPVSILEVTEDFCTRMVVAQYPTEECVKGTQTVIEGWWGR